MWSNIFKKTTNKFESNVQKIFNKDYKAENCEICQVKFSLMKMIKIHLCKRCQRHVCAKCGDQKDFITDYEEQKPKEHRICDDCKIDKDVMYNLIQGNKIKWNTNSQISITWSKIAQQKQQEQQFKQQQFQQQENMSLNNSQNQNSSYLQSTESENQQKTYLQYLEEMENNRIKYQKSIEQINKDVFPDNKDKEGGGRTDYRVFNYSVIDFFVTVQQNIPIECIRESISNVLRAFVVKNPKFGYSQGMNSMAALLLCFAEEEKAFELLDHLINNIYPKQFFELPQFNQDGICQEGFHLEQFIIKIFIKQYFQANEIYEQIMNFVDGQCILLPFLLTCMERNLNFSCLFYLWNQMFIQTSFIPMEQCVVALLQLHKGQILNNVMSPDIKDFILKNTQMSQLQEYMDNIQITEQDRKTVTKEFYKEEHLQLRLQKSSKQKQSVIQIQLGRLMGIKESDMDEIRQKFDEFCVNKEQISNQKHQKTFIKQEQFPQLYQDIFKVLSIFQKKEMDFVPPQQISPELFKRISDLFKNCNTECITEKILYFENFLACICILIKDSFRQKLKIFFKVIQQLLATIQNVEFYRFIDLVQLIEDIQDIHIKNIKQLYLKYEVSNHSSDYKQFIKEVEIKYKNSNGLDFSDLMGILYHPFLQEIYNNLKQNVNNSGQSQQEEQEDLENLDGYNLDLYNSDDLLQSLSKNQKIIQNQEQNQIQKQKQLYTGDTIRIQNEISQNVLTSSILYPNITITNQKQKNKKLSKSQNLAQYNDYEENNNFNPIYKIWAQNPKITNTDQEWEIFKLDYKLQQFENENQENINNSKSSFSQNRSKTKSITNQKEPITKTKSNLQNSLTMSINLQSQVTSTNLTNSQQQFLEEFELIDDQRRKNKGSMLVNSQINSVTLEQQQQDIEELILQQKKNPLLIQNGDCIFLRHKNTQTFFQINPTQIINLNIVEDKENTSNKNSQNSNNEQNPLYSSQQIQSQNKFCEVQSGNFVSEDISNFFFVIQNLNYNSFIKVDEPVRFSNINLGIYISTADQSQYIDQYNLQNKKQIQNLQNSVISLSGSFNDNISVNLQKNQVFGAKTIIYKNQKTENFIIKLAKTNVPLQQSEFNAQIIENNILNQQQFQLIPCYNFNPQIIIRHLKSGMVLGLDNETNKLQLIGQKNIEQLEIEWQLNQQFINKQNIQKNKAQNQQNPNFYNFSGILQNNDIISLENKESKKRIYTKNNLLDKNQQKQILGVLNQIQKLDKSLKFSELFKIILCNPDHKYVGFGTCFRILHKNTQQYLVGGSKNKNIFLDQNIYPDNNDVWVFQPTEGSFPQPQQQSQNNKSNISDQQNNQMERSSNPFQDLVQEKRYNPYMESIKKQQSKINENN